MDINNIKTVERVTPEKAMEERNSKELKHITKAMNDKDQSDVVSVLETELLVNEIDRRTEHVNKIMKNLHDCFVTKYDKDLSLLDKQNFIQEIREIVRA